MWREPEGGTGVQIKGWGKTYMLLCRYSGSCWGFYICDVRGRIKTGDKIRSPYLSNNRAVAAPTRAGGAANAQLMLVGDGVSDAAIADLERQKPLAKRNDAVDRWAREDLASSDHVVYEGGFYASKNRIRSTGERLWCLPLLLVGSKNEIQQAWQQFNGYPLRNGTIMVPEAMLTKRLEDKQEETAVVTNKSANERWQMAGKQTRSEYRTVRVLHSARVHPDLDAKIDETPETDLRTTSIRLNNIADVHREEWSSTTNKRKVDDIPSVKPVVDQVRGEGAATSSPTRTWFGVAILVVLERRRC